MASTLLFVFVGSAHGSSSPAASKGVATGGALSSASAAMLDLHPHRDPAGGRGANGAASAVVSALGILTSSALVQPGSAPLVPPYVVLLALCAVAFAGAYLMREPATNRGRLRLTVERPRFSAAVRRPFLVAGLAALSSWSTGGLFFSLGPVLAHTSSARRTSFSGIGHRRARGRGGLAAARAPTGSTGVATTAGRSRSTPACS